MSSEYERSERSAVLLSQLSKLNVSQLISLQLLPGQVWNVRSAAKRPGADACADAALAPKLVSESRRGRALTIYLPKCIFYKVSDALSAKEAIRKQFLIEFLWIFCKFNDSSIFSR